MHDYNLVPSVDRETDWLLCRLLTARLGPYSPGWALCKSASRVESSPKLPRRTYTVCGGRRERVPSCWSSRPLPPRRVGQDEVLISSAHRWVGAATRVQSPTYVANIRHGTALPPEGVMLFDTRCGDQSSTFAKTLVHQSDIWVRVRGSIVDRQHCHDDPCACPSISSQDQCRLGLVTTKSEYSYNVWASRTQVPLTPYHLYRVSPRFASSLDSCLAS